MSLFFRAKLSCVFLTFILTSQIEGKCQISLLSTQPKLFSPLQWSDLGIFQLSPGYFLIFFPIQAPSSSTYPLGGLFPWHLSASPHTQDLLPGWEFLCIFQPSPTQCPDHEWVDPGCFTWAPLPSIFPAGRGQVSCSTIK